MLILTKCQVIPLDLLINPTTQKNNQNGLGLNTGMLVTVEEDVVGLQGNRSPHHLEGSGTV